MCWYLAHTKPRQEKCALENLHLQGYLCFLPTIPSERLRQRQLTVANEALFPRYLFIRLGQGDSANSWAPICSTKGVSRLVSFWIEPARLDDGLIELLRIQEALVQTKPEGCSSRVNAFAWQKCHLLASRAADGERRVMVLIEILSKPVAVRVAPDSLRRRADKLPRYCLFGKKPFSKS